MCKLSISDELIPKFFNTCVVDTLLYIHASAVRILSTSVVLPWKMPSEDAAGSTLFAQTCVHKIRILTLDEKLFVL